MIDKPKQFNQHKLQPQVFDAYNKDLPIQNALGSQRGKQRLEASDIRSTNWKPSVDGWRLTPTGIEFGDTSGAFPPGSVSLSSIQTIGTDKILGRDTAGTGVIEQLGVGTGLSITGGNLTNSNTGSSAVSTHESAFDHTLIATALQDISGQDLSTADNTTSDFITLADIPAPSIAFADLTDYPADAVGKLKNDGSGNLSWDNTGGGAVEGTAVLSTGEVGGTKYLREDGDGTCSWQAIVGGSGLTQPQIMARLSIGF